MKPKTMKQRKTIKQRLEYLRGEIAELQALADHNPGDVELLQWAGVPEFEDE